MWNHFHELADRMESNPELLGGAPGDVFGNNPLVDRIAFYRRLAGLAETTAALGTNAPTDSVQ